MICTFIIILFVSYFAVNQAQDQSTNNSTICDPNAYEPLENPELFVIHPGFEDIAVRINRTVGQHRFILRKKMNCDINNKNKTTAIMTPTTSKVTTIMTPTTSKVKTPTTSNLTAYMTPTISNVTKPTTSNVTTIMTPTTSKATTPSTSSIQPEKGDENYSTAFNSSIVTNDTLISRNNSALNNNTMEKYNQNSSISQNNNQNLTEPFKLPENIEDIETTTQKIAHHYIDVINVGNMNFFMVRLYSHSNDIKRGLYNNAKEKFEDILKLTNNIRYERLNYSLFGINLFLHYLIKNTDNLGYIKRIQTEVEQAMKKIDELRMNFLSIYKEANSCKLKVFIEFLPNNQEEFQEFELQNYEMRIRVTCKRY